MVIDTAPKGAPKRKQVSRNFRTLQEAREFVTETRQNVAQGRYTAPSKVTFRTLAEDWLKSRRDIREVTRSGYADALGNPLDFFGDHIAQSLSRTDVENLMDHLGTFGGKRGKPLSQRSQVYALQAVRAVFAYGVSVGVLSANPATDVKPRRRTKDDALAVNIWAPAQLVQFVAHVDTHEEEWTRAAFRLSACGLRRSEVLGLAWSEVDLDSGTVKVEASRVKVGRGSTTNRDATKSKASSRAVPVEEMWPGTVAALRALKARQAADRLAMGTAWPDSGLVVVDESGSPIQPDAYSGRWRVLRADAGLPRIRLHELRHSIATTLHRSGVAPADAAGLLGHEVATHMSFYVQSTKTGAEEAARTLGSVLRTVQ
ncbi:tyrosine-type recombinase/integrase [Nocardioides soli]|uniref:Integrase n=1 Tax=Nocardioides soli TaxID=1036020 RepID=A0A7W4VUE4_9ACTN|nr:integrase [Nocardioides soli]